MHSKQNRQNSAALFALTAVVVGSSLAVAACGGGGSERRDPPVHEMVVTDDVVQSDLLTSGADVRVAARVEGDVAAAGADVTISGPIDGYILGAGRTVTVEAPIGNDVWAAGERVTLASSVGNNAMIAGQRVHLEPGTTIGHDARLAGAEVRSEGRVAHDLTIGAGRAEIGGEIGGSVHANAGRVTVLPNAVVRGNLVVRSPEPPTISPGAQVAGNVDYRPTDAGRRWFNWPTFWLGLFLSLSILNLAALAVVPAWSGRVAETLRARTLSSMLAGALVLIVAPIVVALLAVTIVGIPLAVVLTAVYASTLVLAAAFVSYRVGISIFQRLHRTGTSRWIAMVAGALVVSLGVSLPIVGWIIALVVVMAGAGALALEWRGPRGHPQLA
jgi:hypothetical protein